MLRDDDLGENIWRSSSPTIISKTTMAVKRKEKTDRGLACPSEKKTAWGRPELPHCGTCRMSGSEDSGGYFGGYSVPGGEV